MAKFNFSTERQRAYLADYDNDRESCLHDLALFCAHCRTPYDSIRDLDSDEEGDLYCWRCIGETAMDVWKERDGR